MWEGEIVCQIVMSWNIIFNYYYPCKYVYLFCNVQKFIFTFLAAYILICKNNNKALTKPSISYLRKLTNLSNHVIGLCECLKSNPTKKNTKDVIGRRKKFGKIFYWNISYSYISNFFNIYAICLIMSNFICMHIFINSSINKHKNYHLEQV